MPLAGKASPGHSPVRSPDTKPRHRWPLYKVRGLSRNRTQNRKADRRREKMGMALGAVSTRGVASARGVVSTRDVASTRCVASTRDVVSTRDVASGVRPIDAAFGSRRRKGAPTPGRKWEALLKRARKGRSAPVDMPGRTRPRGHHSIWKRRMLTFMRMPMPIMVVSTEEPP